MEGDEMNEFLDLHLTALANWLLNTIGLALVLASIVGAVIGAVAVAADGSWAWGLPGGVFAFGITLYLASAPVPPVLDD